jgi:hypothetical protein
MIYTLVKVLLASFFLFFLYHSFSIVSVVGDHVKKKKKLIEDSNFDDELELISRIVLTHKHLNG